MADVFCSTAAVAVSCAATAFCRAFRLVIRPVTAMMIAGTAARMDATHVVPT